jgi:predicted alpha/beta-fold hydrolase
LVYLLSELYVRSFKSPKYIREEFKLQDGGLAALDWSVDRDGTALPITGPDGKLTKPILILLPGLSGGNDNLYTVSVMRRAQKLGYKCCTAIMRGCSGLPLKTPLLTYVANH